MILLEIIRSDGYTISAGDGREEWELLAKEGAANVDVEHFFAERGYGHGDIYQGRRIKGRTIKYTLKDRVPIPRGRRRESAFFNVLDKYKIKSHINDKHVWVDARLVNVKHTEDFYNAGVIEAEFYAADPYWRDMSDTQRLFYTKTGMWHYPYALVDLKAGYPREAYTLYEQIGVGKDVYIYNDGDAPTAILIVIQGPTNPLTININGATVQFTAPLKAGETLKMDFDKGVYTINDSTNVLRFMRIDGSPQLLIGDNVISANVPVYGSIIFSKKYNGDM